MSFCLRSVSVGRCWLYVVVVVGPRASDGGRTEGQVGGAAGEGRGRKRDRVFERPECNVWDGEQGA